MGVTLACTTCGEVREEEAFPFHKRRSEGRQSVCRPCAARARSAIYYRRHSEVCNTRTRAWQRANLDRVATSRIAWREANPHKVREEARNRRSKMSDEERERRRFASASYYAKNRERLLAKCRESNAADPERNRQRVQKWNERNPERAAVRVQAWKRGNPEAVRAMRRLYRQTRRARSRVAGRPARAHIARLLQEKTCVYCGVPFDATVRARWLTVDHLVPLACGGTNASENLFAACYACNRSKGSRLLGDWKKNPRPGWTPVMQAG